MLPRRQTGLWLGALASRGRAAVNRSRPAVTPRSLSIAGSCRLDGEDLGVVDEPVRHRRGFGIVTPRYVRGLLAIAGACREHGRSCCVRPADLRSVVVRERTRRGAYAPVAGPRPRGRPAGDHTVTTAAKTMQYMNISLTTPRTPMARMFSWIETSGQLMTA